MCKNVTAMPIGVGGSRDTPGDADEYVFEHGVVDRQALDVCTDHDLFRAADIVCEIPHICRYKYELGDTCKAMGLNHNANGPLLCQELRPYVCPAKGNAYDPMHCFFSNGVVQADLQLMMEQFVAAGILWEDLHSFCQADWRLPSVTDTPVSLKQVFRPGMLSAKGFPRMQAREAMAVPPITQHILEAVVMKSPHADIFAL